ncbi:MAG: thioesterase [Chloroflexi bacterium]|nr:thioesterase [Chloroflexota bacterium]
MDVETVWTEETRVRSFETDFQMRWKLSGIFQAMQEAATHHAGHLGYAYEKMLAREKIWILSRVKVAFYQFPVMGENVVIRTWPKGIQQKVFFMRDFQFSAPDGRGYAAATSAWILVNPTARRMLPPQALNAPLPDNDGRSALDEPLDKISPSGVLEERFVTQAGYSSVDLMGHVNNARYIDWIADCFPIQVHAAQTLDWLQINYVNEVKPGECVSVAAGPAQPGSALWFVQGTNQTTAARAFEAMVKWSEGIIL